MFANDTEADRNGQNEDIIAIDNHRSAGRAHWLIIPKQSPAARHIRDIEALIEDDLPLRRWCHNFSLLMVRSSLTNHRGEHLAVQEMARVKEQLLRQHFPDAPRSSIHCGYHRGRRHFIGPIFLPDIVSIHHLHLHVIVEPRMNPRIFKYPAWFRFMWMSDEKVISQIVKSRKSSRMRIKHRAE